MKIFISYRRSDSQLQARLLRQCVEKYVAPDNVFMDVHSIPDGADFAQYINERVAQCKVLFVVIGKDWLDARGETGARRLDDLHDFVRAEIAAGLRRRTVNVIPLLLDGASMPLASALPADIEDLPKRNGRKIREESFEADVDALMKKLGLDERSNFRRRLLIGAGALVALGAGGGASYITRWPPQFYALPDHVANAVRAAREAEGQAFALMDSVEASILAAQNAKARALSAGDGTDFEFGAPSVEAGRYQGQRRAPDRLVHGVFESVSGEGYEGQWRGFEYEGKGQLNTGSDKGIVSCLGEFTANVLNGPGRISYSDDSEYRGDIIGRVPRGFGARTDTSTGTTFVGRFMDGELHGSGAEFRGDLPVRFGVWRRGQLIRDEAQRDSTVTASETSNVAPSEEDPQIAEALTQARAAEQQGVILAERGRQAAALAQQFAVDARAAAGGEMPPGLSAMAWGPSQYAGQTVDADGALGVYTRNEACCMGDVYAGEFSAFGQHFSGLGVYTFPQTSTAMLRQTGQFTDSLQSHQGEIEFTDGRTYCGSVARDAPNGLGVMRSGNGVQWVGQFADGQLHGLGVEYAADGSIARQGRWQNGQLTEAS